MRKFYLFALALSMWCGHTLSAQHAFIDQGVLNQLSTADENDLIPIILSIEDHVDIIDLKAELNSTETPVDKRAQVVMQRLKTKANETQPQIVTQIENAGFAYDKLQRFWISNIIAVEATPTLVDLLSQNEAISQIVYNPAVFALQEPIRSTGTRNVAKSVGGIEPGLEAIGAPFMWAMGYTGHGTIAFTFDTGIMPDHPSHSERFLGNLMPLESTWFAYDSPIPTDRPGNHGTHVTGTILGLDPETADTIGVAPGAYFISSDVTHNNNDLVRSLADFMLGFEWALNPDGDEETSDDIPDVINNSWGSQDIDDLFDGWAYCDDFVASTLDAVLAAGIATVFSAGNLGPVEQSISAPHNINTGLVNSFTVAAVSGTGSHTVADFSSRGPSRCEGEGGLLIKPEVSAPGINVRSSVGHDEYDNSSGTSMAAPHTSGAILLLREAFPQLTGEEIELALYYSADDLGEPGEDNTYGMGMINLENAFNYLSESYEPTPPQILENDLAIVSIDEPMFELGCGMDVAPVISVSNLGLNAIENYTIRYDINGQNEGELVISESIAPDETVQVSLPSIAYSGSGLMELHIWIEEITNEYDLFNNHRTTRWQQLKTFDTNGYLWFEEYFDDGIDLDVWTISNPDGGITWDTLDVYYDSFNQLTTAAWMNHPDYTDIQSQKDKLISPIFIDAGGGTNWLSFSYYYRKRGNNSFTQDTLAVYLSNGCEEPQELWKAGGSELWTNDNSLQDALPELQEEWGHVFLVTETSDEDFYIYFESTNRRGNNLLIDEIWITSPFSTRNTKIIDFEMYPNPAKNMVTIIPNSAQKSAFIEVRDISGRSLLKRKETKSMYSIDIDNFASGVYMVTISYESGQKQTQKLIVE